MSSRRQRLAAGWSVIVVGAIAIATGAIAVTHPVVEVGGTAVPAASHRSGTGIDRSGTGMSSSEESEATSPAPSATQEEAVKRTAPPPAATEPATSAVPPTTRTITVEPPQTETVTVTAEPAPATTPREAEAPTTPSPERQTVQPTIKLSGDAALYADTESAVAAVEAYWDYIFTGWDVTWYGPIMWAGDGFYDSESAIPGPSCGGEPIELNAAYCGNGVVGEGFVSWDLQLMRMGYEVFGDSFVYLVVAHEWGHVAQERFVADGEEPAVLLQQELQADCLAGATLTKAAELGYLQIEPGDTDELIDSLVAMGDSHTWTQVDDHGSSDQRVAWFTKGFNGDIESCLGNR